MRLYPQNHRHSSIDQQIEDAISYCNWYIASIVSCTLCNNKTQSIDDQWHARIGSIASCSIPFYICDTTPCPIYPQSSCLHCHNRCWNTALSPCSPFRCTLFDCFWWVNELQKAFHYLPNCFFVTQPIDIDATIDNEQSSQHNNNILINSDWSKLYLHLVCYLLE